MSKMARTCLRVTPSWTKCCARRKACHWLPVMLISMRVAKRSLWSKLVKRPLSITPTRNLSAKTQKVTKTTSNNSSSSNKIIRIRKAEKEAKKAKVASRKETILRTTIRQSTKVKSSAASMPRSVR